MASKSSSFALGQSSANMSKLLDSGSLVDLLNIKRKSGSKKSRTGGVSSTNRKPNKEAMELIATIIKEETGANAQNYVRKKRKPEKEKEKVVNKKSSFLAEDTFKHQRAISLRKTTNNIFTLSSGLGLAGDDAAYVERQNQAIRTLMTAVESKIDDGYMQICGSNSDRFTNSDGSLLINYTSLTFDKFEFRQICVNSSIEDGSSEKDEFLLDYDSWKVGILSNFRKRFIISVMAERRGQIRPSFIKSQLDQLIIHKTLKFVSSGELLHKSYSFADSRSFIRGGAGDDEFKEISVHQFSETGDVDMFSLTVDNGSGKFERSNSQPSGDILGLNKDFDDNSMTSSRLGRRPSLTDMMSASKSTFTVPSLDLPPLRSKKKILKNAHKRSLIEEGGFDDNLGRSTPRCLKTNVKSKPSIQALRRELSMAQESANMLNSLVDDNIAWVNTNCKATVGVSSVVSIRTKERCRRLSLDKMFDFFENMLDNFKLRILNKWKTYSKYCALQQMAIKYNKAKSLEILCWALGEAVNRQYNKLWAPWFSMCKMQILEERNAASCEIQKIIRGFLGRIKAFRIKLGKFAIKIQCMLRKKFARKRVQKRRKDRNIRLVNQASRVIQEWFRGRVRVFKAKRRVMRRRYHRAATRIQKIFRGHKGRHRFAAIKSKVLASMKPKTPQGKGVLNSVKSWFGPAAEPIDPSKNNEPAKVEPVHSTTPALRPKKEKKQIKIATSDLGEEPAPAPKPAPQVKVLPVEDPVPIINKEIKEIKEEKKPATPVEVNRPNTTEESKPATPQAQKPSTPIIETATESTIVTLENNDIKEETKSEITSSRLGSTTDVEEIDENGVVTIQRVIRGKLARKEKEAKLAEKKSKGLVRAISSSGSNAFPSTATTKSVESSKKPVTAHQTAPSNANASSASRSASKQSDQYESSKAAIQENTVAVSTSKTQSSVTSRPTSVAGPENLSEPTEVKQLPSLTSLKTRLNANTEKENNEESNQKTLTQSRPSSQQQQQQQQHQQQQHQQQHHHHQQQQQQKQDSGTQENQDQLLRDARFTNNTIIDEAVAPFSENDISTSATITSNNDTFDDTNSSFVDKQNNAAGEKPPTPSSFMARAKSLSEYFSRPNTASPSTALNSDESAAEGSAAVSRPSSRLDTITKSLSNWGFGTSSTAGTISDAEDTATSQSAAANDGSLNGRFGSPGKFGDIMEKAKEMINPLTRKLSEHGTKFADLVGNALEGTSRAGSPLKRVSSRKKFVRPTMTQEEACAKIQAAVRIKLAKARVQLKRNKIIMAQKRVANLLLWAVRSMQRIVRGKLGRKRFKAQEFAVKKDKAKKQEIMAIRIQKVYRGMKGRRRFSSLNKKREEERKMAQWMKYSKAQKKQSKKKGAEEQTGKPVSPQKGGAVSSQQVIGPDGKVLGQIPDSWNEDEEDEKMRALDEKLAKLEELEQKIKAKEEKMEAASKLSEQRAAAMEKALKEIEEKMKIEEAERLARQQLIELAGGISQRSDYFSSHGSVTRNTGRGSMASGRKLNTARDGPPTARSARDGIPPDAPRLMHGGKEWRQLFDPEQKAMYWYCPVTQEAQWETPGEDVSYDSGYESSGGALTDYSTDYDSGNDNIYQTGGGSVWQEYYDEQAQGKYWYNHTTGEATWTRPSNLGSARPAAGANPGSYGSGSPNDWVSYLDEATGQEYWYNIITGETSWA